MNLSDDDFGSDIALDDELELALQAAETQDRISVPPDTGAVPEEGRAGSTAPADIEDLVLDEEQVSLSPFEQFRKKGWLSVSDLVGTVWCEVQYDYRLRTLPYLPPSERPSVIKSDKGKEIPVDKAKVEGKERILRRGQKIHKRLEREIHPQEVVVQATTREDVWGLRFLNMFSGLESLITLGKCRELPVVGFIDGVLVMGIIDELARKPIDKTAETGRDTRSSRQTSLKSFFSPTKPRPAQAVPRVRTHRVYLSDSKTRASGVLPNESDTVAGRLQCMVYKELLDAMLLGTLAVKDPQEPSPSSSETTPREAVQVLSLPTCHPLAFHELFQLLSLDPLASFTDSFVVQSRPVITGNALRFGTDQAGCLDDMVKVWARYVEALGLGEPGAGDPSGQKAKGQAKTVDGNGRTDNRLELVYRRAGPKKSGKREKRPRQRRQDRAENSLADETSAVESQATTSDSTEDTQVPAEAATPMDDHADDLDLQAAISASLVEVSTESVTVGTAEELEEAVDPSTPKKRHNTDLATADQSDEKEDDELALAIEMSLAGNDVTEPEPAVIALPLSQGARTPSNNYDLDDDAEKTADSNTGAGRTPTSSASSRTPSPDRGTASGGIIGRHRFQHDPVLLQTHLRSVLQYWTGEREPVGVAVHQTNRCGWCEFEEGCEWRARKAEELLLQARRTREVRTT